MAGGSFVRRGSPTPVLAALLGCAALSAPTPARAQNEDAGAEAVAKHERAPGEGKDPDTTRARFWSEGSARPFFATSIDLGYLYLRPRAIVGYGRPFWTWFGFEANPQVSQRFLGAYAGINNNTYVLIMETSHVIIFLINPIS